MTWSRESRTLCLANAGSAYRGGRDQAERIKTWKHTGELISVKWVRAHVSGVDAVDEQKTASIWCDGMG